MWFASPERRYGALGLNIKPSRWGVWKRGWGRRTKEADTCSGQCGTSPSFTTITKSRPLSNIPCIITHFYYFTSIRVARANQNEYLRASRSSGPWLSLHSSRCRGKFKSCEVMTSWAMKQRSQRERFSALKRRRICIGGRRGSIRGAKQKRRQPTNYKSSQLPLKDRRKVNLPRYFSPSLSVCGGTTAIVYVTQPLATISRVQRLENMFLEGCQKVRRNTHGAPHLWLSASLGQPLPGNSPCHSDCIVPYDRVVSRGG